MYILLCNDGSLYTGITRDLCTRVAAHNAGTGARYTRSRLPVALVYQESALDRGEASRREWKLKRMKRQAKLALITAGAATHDGSCVPDRFPAGTRKTATKA